MKRALRLTLVLSLAASPLPVSAQERVAQPARQGGKSGQSGWPRVLKTAAGTDVLVITEDSNLLLRGRFVSADDSGLTVLNLTDPALSASAGRALREMASQHPEYLEGAVKGGTFLVGNLRLDRAGVFMADRKIADLQQIVETSARTNIAEIRTRRKGRGVWGHLGPLGGYFVGALSGGYVAGLACQATAGRSRCDTGAFLTGALVGGIAGMGYGFHAARRETEEVIYRAHPE